jgi:ribosomal protein L24E
MSWVDHERKIRNRRGRTDIGKCSFVNKTISYGTGYLQKF